VFGELSEAEHERISVLQTLIEFDSVAANAYADEIRQIARDRVINSRLEEVDKSRIYVDVGGIKSLHERQITEDFARYSALLKSPRLDRKTMQIIRLYRGILEKHPEIVEKYSEIKLLTLPSSEQTALFESMFSALWEAFFQSPQFGLDTYLSTRIRHGTILGHLRGPLDLHHVVTTRASSGREYEPNRYWRGRLNKLLPEELDFLDSQLRKFSERVDEQLTSLGAERIQIKSSAKPNGLFDLQGLGRVAGQVRRQITPEMTYDEFIDLVFRHLWSFTGGLLSNVREYLTNEFSQALSKAFDALVNGLDNGIARSGIGELHDEIARAHTDLQTAIRSAANWFRVPTVIEREPFTFDVAIQVTIESVKYCNRSKTIHPAVNNSSTTMFRGDTLNPFRDILSIFVENVLVHSRILNRSPYCEITAEETDSRLSITVCSELGRSVDKDATALKLQEEEARYARGPSFERAVTEGGSGFVKVRRIADTDLKSNSVLSLGMSGDRCRVVFSVDIGGLRVP
jgi:hypothetical protein